MSLTSLSYIGPALGLLSTDRKVYNNSANKFGMQVRAVGSFISASKTLLAENEPLKILSDKLLLKAQKTMDKVNPSGALIGSVTGAIVGSALAPVMETTSILPTLLAGTGGGLLGNAIEDRLKRNVNKNLNPKALANNALLQSKELVDIVNQPHSKDRVVTLSKARSELSITIGHPNFDSKELLHAFQRSYFPKTTKAQMADHLTLTATSLLPSEVDLLTQLPLLSQEDTPYQKALKTLTASLSVIKNPSLKGIQNIPR